MYDPTNGTRNPTIKEMSRFVPVGGGPAGGGAAGGPDGGGPIGGAPEVVGPVSGAPGVIEVPGL